jgi:hypothetical protein
MTLLQGGHSAKRIEILNNPAAQVVCPVCGAKRGIPCHVQPTVLRFDSHLERKELAEVRALQRLAESKAVSFAAARDPGKPWSDA